MKIVRQLLREFWIPLILGLAWTVYNLSDKANTSWSFREFINIFAPTSFFVSWLVAQWYRVKKQQKVEDGLIGIEGQVKQMLTDLEDRTNDLVGHITGGGSFCYLNGSVVSPVLLSNLKVIHVGKHPLYNVKARIVNLEQLDQSRNNPTLERIHKVEDNLKVGDLIAGHSLMVGRAISLGQGDVHRFNIFFTARNGNFVQQLRFRNVNGSWLAAIKVDKGETVFERIQEGFPRNAEGGVDWSA